MGEFVEISTYEEPPPSRHPVNFTTAAPTNSPANFLYNKYVVVGVLTFFVTMFLITIVIHLVKSRIFTKDPIRYSIASEESASLMGSDDENLDNMYTSCQLYVADDDEMNKDMAGDDFEYDCSSLDGGLSVLERRALVSVLRENFNPDATVPSNPSV